jgi:uncharacterized protein (DUF1697 family)
VTDRRVALLRGINVGTAKRIAMADLRTLFEDLGHRDVATLLNSGNVVFTVVRKGAVDEAARIEKAIVDRLGVSTRVTILTAGELATALDANPLKAIARDPSRMLLMALSDQKASARLKPLLGQRWAPEAIALGTRVAYLWCANGIAKGRLWTEANRAVGDGGTARNLSTMTKLLALASKP